MAVVATESLGEEQIGTLHPETCSTGFVRAKKRGGRTYYYLVRNNRQGDRVRQQVIAYLGHYPSLEEAIASLPDEIEEKRNSITRLQSRAEAAKSACHPAWLERNGGEVPRDWRRGIKFRNSPMKQYWQWRQFAEADKLWLQRLEGRLAKLHSLVYSEV